MVGCVVTTVTCLVNNSVGSLTVAWWVGSLTYIWYTTDSHWVTLSFAETKVWDVIKIQNVLNHVSDRPSHLTGKRRKSLKFSVFGPWWWLTVSSIKRVCFLVLQKARVVEEWAGLRPGRSPVRLESETVTFGNRKVTVGEHLLCWMRP